MYESLTEDPQTICTFDVSIPANHVIHAHIIMTETHQSQETVDR